MRIICPVCSAAYEVRDELLVPGRTLRCSRCSEQWTVVPPDPEAEQETEPEAEPFHAAEDHQPPAAPRLTAMDRLASHPAPLPARNTPLRVAWLASVLLLVAVLVGMVVWRDTIMRAWPPSARLYSAMGFTPAPQPHGAGGR